MSIYLGNTLIAGSNGNGVEKSTTNGILKKQVSESHHPIIENNDGTIILKAGSKLYTGGYLGILTIDEDLDISNVEDMPQGTKDYAIVLFQYNSDYYDSVGGVPVEVLGKPPHQYYISTVCYELDTTGPYYKPIYSSSSYSATLPICIVRTDGTVEPYIKDVYQIGDACLVFKDSLKVSIPNGRNPDGTLNNLIVSSVDSTLTDISGTDKIYIDSAGVLRKSSNCEYNQHENYNKADGSNVLYAKIGDVSSIDDVIQVATKEDLKSVVNYNNISNCVTHIPQDIKLNLVDGNLTLKAGSKVYIPNNFEDDGTTPYFDEVFIPSDIVRSGFSGTYARTLIVKSDGSAISPYANVYSGSSAPTVSGNAIWYDTNNNLVKTTSDSGSTWTTGWSLPIAIVSSTDGVITSIDQVFNGFGYIGSTAFVLPGIKGLIPNGRNEDGSLKSIMIENTQTITRTFSSGINGFCMASPNRESYPISTRAYDTYTEENNLFTVSVLNGVAFDIAEIACDSTGKITLFQPKTTFHVLDYNDRATVLTWGRPDYNSAISLGTLTLPYTCPYNGYYVLYVDKSGGNKIASILINGVPVCMTNFTNTYSSDTICIECSLGDVVTAENALDGKLYRSRYIPYKGVN